MSIFILFFFHIFHRITLEIMTLQPKCDDVETAEGVAITVTGVAQVNHHTCLGMPVQTPQTPPHSLSPCPPILSSGVTVKSQAWWLSRRGLKEITVVVHRGVVFSPSPFPDVLNRTSYISLKNLLTHSDWRYLGFKNQLKKSLPGWRSRLPLNCQTSPTGFDWSRSQPLWKWTPLFVQCSLNLVKVSQKGSIVLDVHLGVIRVLQIGAYSYFLCVLCVCCLC